MSWNIGLNINETLLEIFAQEEDQSIIEKQFFLIHSNIEQSLVHFIKEHKIQKITEIKINIKFADKTIRQRMGTPPAFIVTQGFENWLELNLPMSSSFFTLFPKRTHYLLDNDLVFGITERTSAKGEVSTPIDLQELEFLTSKLELLNIQNISIGLLHSNLNPSNLNTAINFLEKKGFNVFNFSEVNKDECEKNRWWHNVLEAYIEPAYEEVSEQITTALKQTSATEKVNISIQGQQKTYNLNDKKEWLNTFLGAPSALLRHFKTHNIRKDFLYLGYEDFYFFCNRVHNNKLFQHNLGPLSFKLHNIIRLNTQPTQILEKCFWQTVKPLDTESYYDPGPLFMGRSQKPTLLDVFFCTDRLQNIPLFKEFYNIKAKHKIQDAIALLSKPIVDSSSLTINEIIENIEEFSAKSILTEISQYKSSYPLYIFGPLANALSPLIEEHSHAFKVHKIHENKDHMMQTLIETI